MSKMWFTSDHHFGHANIIKYANRPFADVDEMDEGLINRWNEKIRDNDSVYYLGDFALAHPDRTKEILKRLNGSIYLIEGNHERAALACKKRFEWIKPYYELNIQDDSFESGRQKIILFHYAIRQWNERFHGSYHLYGHAHGSLEEDLHALSFDIGVDNHNFYPLEYAEVKAKMIQKSALFPIEPNN